MQLCVSRRNAIKIAFQVSLYPSHLLSTPATTKSKSHTHERARGKERERVQSCCTCTTNNKANFVWLFGSLQGCQHAHTHARMKHIREMSMCVCLCVCVCKPCSKKPVSSEAR